MLRQVANLHVTARDSKWVTIDESTWRPDLALIMSMFSMQCNLRSHEVIHALQLFSETYESHLIGC